MEERAVNNSITGGHFYKALSAIYLVLFAVVWVSWLPPDEPYGIMIRLVVMVLLLATAAGHSLAARRAQSSQVNAKNDAP